MIPMIDVMMFLLFFFMVSSLAMAVQSGLAGELAQSVDRKSALQPERDDDNHARQQGFPQHESQGINQLKAGLNRLNVGADNLVIINADKHVEHGSGSGRDGRGAKGGHYPFRHRHRPQLTQQNAARRFIGALFLLARKDKR